MRNTVLRSPNPKYHYSHLFFYKTNKGHLIYSRVFWFEISDFVIFFGCSCLPHVTLFIIRGKGSTKKQPAIQTQARSHLSVSLSGFDLTELPHTVVKDIWAQANIILERYMY